MKKAELRPLFFTDDWGMSPAINEAILNLAELGLVYGVSALSDARFVTLGVEKLKTFSNIKFGLHFNLTFHDQFHIVKSKNLLLKSFVNRIWLNEEIFRQLKLVKAKLGRIDYIDGHQHVHLLPWIAPLINKHAENASTLVRISVDPSHFGSWLLGYYSKQFISKKNIMKCEYLVSDDFKISQHLKNRVKESSYPLIFHPASSNDFEKYGVPDKLCEFRIRQYDKILECFDGA